MCAAARRSFHYFCRPFNLSSLSPSAKTDGKHAETTWKLLLPVNRLSVGEQMGSGRTRRKERCQRMTEKLKLGRGKLNGWKIIVSGQIDVLPEITTYSNDFVTLLSVCKYFGYFDYYIPLFGWFLIYCNINCNCVNMFASLLNIHCCCSSSISHVNCFLSTMICFLFYILRLLSRGVTTKKSAVNLSDFSYLGWLNGWS